MKFFKLIVLLLACSTLSFSQDAGFALQMDVALVTVDVRVNDAQGMAVTSLNQGDFLILEDGVPREIRNFSPAGAPYSTLLLFDASGSTQSQWPFLVEAVNGFIHSLGAGDRLALASFAGNVEKLMDWRLARGERMDVVMRAPSPTAVGAPSPLQGASVRVSLAPFLGTDFYGALEWAASEARDVNGRRGVLVFTDGQDSRGIGTQERAAFERALSAVERSASPFYFVGINTDLNPDPSGMATVPIQIQKNARGRMEELASRSGGRIFLPKTIEDVVPLYAEIARELGTLYTLGFAPARVDSAGYHRIEVRAKDDRFKVLQSRQGYNSLDSGDSVVKAAAPVPAAVVVAPAPVPAPIPPPATVAASAQNDSRSVLMGPAAAGYAIPRGATIYIAPGTGFENELRAAFQKNSFPLRIVMNRPDADFILANEAPPGNPPSITVSNAKTGVVCFAYTLRRSVAPNGGQSAAETVASNLSDKVTSGK